MKNERTSAWKAALAKVFIAVMIILSVAVIPVASAKAATAPSLNKSSRNILIGANYNLNVVNKIKGSTYVWTTGDSAIATVDQKGIVKGKKMGSTVITCTVTTPDKAFDLVCNVTVIQRALSFSIKNKVDMLNVGQVYDLDRTIRPLSSNDKTTWSSSDTSIASPDKNGKFTALKEGTVTITGTTLGGKSDSVTIKVVDADGTVTTQKELETLLASGVSKITITTTADIDFTIPSGEYKNTKLVVIAPKADVHNYGVFASIDIVEIAKNSWYEEAVGNLLNILSDDSRVVVGENAVVKITVNENGAKLVIENNGKIEEFVIEKPADVNVSGDSKDIGTVAINVPGITITSSVPLNVDCHAKVTLVLEKGAEASKVSADTMANVPAIQGEVKISVKVAPVTVGGQTSTVEVVGSPIVNTVTPPPSTGGPTPPPATPKITKTTNLSDGSVSYTLAQPYTALSAINITYNNETFAIDSFTLEALKGFLNQNSFYLNLWTNMSPKTYTNYGDQDFTVSGSVGPTKTVTFIGGKLGSKHYTVTVNGNGSVTIVSGQTGLTFTVTKVDNYTLKINTSASGLVFDPTF